uniref:Uncharacterized protein n=1 Tax=Ditylenchus dipsaci TaxID=166011 RepID=A0A915DNW7_9BILA
MILDSMLLLRLLLHKLSWDLSLVAKKRLAALESRNTVVGGNSDCRAYSSCSLGGNSFKNFGKSKSFDRREDQSIKNKDKRFLRIKFCRNSRPKRFSSGAKELRKERRKRLGTDTSSGSSKSKKTNSSSSSVHKHLPKYIQSLFRGRMGTDPCKRHVKSGDSSPDSETGSEAVLEFTKNFKIYHQHDEKRCDKCVRTIKILAIKTQVEQTVSKKQN